jgi:hypothetical protein
MSKLIAYCPLLYGGEYLHCAIKSVEPFVDSIHMLYTPRPSYGHGTTVGCPESESDLMNIAYSASKKVRWHKVEANAEGVHRGMIFKIADAYNADGILAFDADEVFGDLTEWIPKFMESKCRRIGFTGYINFWKSFNHACYDQFAPIRFHNLHNKDGEENMPVTVYHFGCAQRMEIMRYKLEVHGHKSELRPNWLRDVYEKWEPGMVIDKGLHVVAHNLWPQATEFDRETLPLCLKQHHNYPKEVIE